MAVRKKGGWGSRRGIRGADVAPFLCWWQKCFPHLPARSTHCSANHLWALHPSALAVNLENLPVNGETPGEWAALRRHRGCSRPAQQQQFPLRDLSCVTESRKRSYL